MKINLEKGPKKTAIVSYGTRITLDGLNVRVVDMIYLRKYLLEVVGRSEVDFVTLKSKKDTDYEYVKDIRETSLQDYDEVIIYNSVPNVFGGVFKGEAMHTFFDLYDYVLANRGTVWYFFCEEAAYPSDFSAFVKYKRYGQPFVKTTFGNMDVSDEYCAKWKETVYGNMKVMFVGNDYDEYVRKYNEQPKKGKYAEFGIKDILEDTDWAYLPLFEYYANAEELEAKRKVYPFSDRTVDLVYYGNHRAGRRNKIVKDLYDRPELKTMFIGYDPEYKNSTPEVYDYVNHDELFPMLAKSYATVVLCSDSHNDIVRTPRFFEALNLDIVAFIWHEYDKDKKFIQNEELKNFVYFSSYDELKTKLDKIKSDETFFRHIISLEQAEADRMYQESLTI